MLDAGAPPLRPRSLAAAVALCVGVSLTVLGSVAPASAADAPVLSNLKTFVVGHVTGTVSTASPYVLVRLGTSTIVSGPLAVTNGSVNFNLPTWGFASTTVQAIGCSTTVVADCDTPTAESTRFTPRDSTATFDLLSGRTVANGQRPRVSVTDTQGGGVLRILWNPDDTSARTAQQDVARSGSTYLDFLAATDADGDGVGDSTQVDDGTGSLVLWRCAGPADPDQCRVQSTFQDGANPISVRVEVDHSVWSTGSLDPSTIGATPTTFALPITVSDAGSYRLTWKVVPADNQNVTRASGSQDFTMTGTTADLSIPVNQLDEGTYVVLADLARSSQLGTAFTSRVTTARGGTPPTFEVDQSAPAGAVLSSNHPDVFPTADSYLDTIAFSLTGQHEQWNDVGLELQNNSDFSIVHSQQLGNVTPSAEDAQSSTGGRVAFAAWNGRDDASGAFVPEGGYTAIATVHDTFGNPQVVRSSFWVDSRHLVSRTWHRTLNARAYVAVKVGRCSSVRHPASRHWAYSVTMASGSRAHCRVKGAPARAISLTYAPSVPVVPATVTSQSDAQLANPGGYRSVSLRAYGGAALGRRSVHSVATMRWLDANGRPGVARRLTSALGWHPMTTRSPAGLIRRDHTARWTTTTAGTNTYDVKNYELTLVYTSLE